MKKKLIVITVDMICTDEYESVWVLCRDKISNIIKIEYESYKNEILSIGCNQHEITGLDREDKIEGHVTGAVYTFVIEYNQNTELNLPKINQMNEILHDLISALLYDGMDSKFECLSISMSDISGIS